MKHNGHNTVQILQIRAKVLKAEEERINGAMKPVWVEFGLN